MIAALFFCPGVEERPERMLRVCPCGADLRRSERIERFLRGIDHQEDGTRHNAFWQPYSSLRLRSEPSPSFPLRRPETFPLNAIDCSRAGGRGAGVWPQCAAFSAPHRGMHGRASGGDQARGFK